MKRDYPNLLVTFFDEIAEGEEFERWPHHITVLPWFKANKVALEAVKNICHQHLPLTVQVGVTTKFGIHQDIPVRLIESLPLMSLHRALLNRPGVLGLRDSRFVADSYRPHVTLQGIGDPTEGQSLEIKSIYLVKLYGPGHLKRVEQIFS